jgi:hypothetical protein
MDSRCIVAALRKKMLKVFTFNFSLPDTQDMQFAAEFAEKIGAIHTTTIRPINPDWSMLMAAELKTLYQNHSSEITRPKLIWSGDGGSVCLGHVHLSKEIIELMRLKEYKRAITTFILQEKYQLPIKIFKKKYANILSEIPQISIQEELNDINCNDPGRSFFLFLLFNDQRKHLFQHFENIDINRIEYHLPFFDGEFLEPICQCPIDECLYHSFYTKFFHLFPETIYSVPWQTYPGHEPCTLQSFKSTAYQWGCDHLEKTRKDNKRDSLKKADKLIKSSDFPDLFSKNKLIMAKTAYEIGLRNYEYLIEVVSLYSRIWGICAGKWSI